MFDLDEEDLYVPNTEAMRNYLESLNYTLKPISFRERREIVDYRSICFSEWIDQFEAVKKSNTMYYSMDAPTLTEDQSKFVMNILHVCPDYATFKEALEQYIHNNPQPLE